MLFNSLAYLFIFLPITVAGYFALTHHGRSRWALVWLLAASMAFYAYWKLSFLPVLLVSIAVNYALGRQLSLRHATHKSTRGLLVIAVAANLGLLGYYKYLDFFIANINSVVGTQYSALGILLPLGISFFTFTQLAFLIDAARGKVRELDPLRYALFVTFFPHLLAGPILHHREMMPQFGEPTRQRLHTQNIMLGVVLIVIGLGKKVLLADPLAAVANAGFAAPTTLGAGDAWLAALAYTFQLYFDFSGYCDMAVGGAKLINIDLPINFASPYRALDIQDFWRRWHITLSRFLRDYLYVPLGGNRQGEWGIATATVITFVLGGFWHGANWTYLAWGAMNGLALVVLRLWRRTGVRLPTLAAWGLTLGFCVFAWVMFRAATVSDAVIIMRAMLGFTTQPAINVPDWQGLAQATSLELWWRNARVGFGLAAFAMAWLVAFWPRNSNMLAEKLASGLATMPRWRAVSVGAALGALLFVAVLNLQNPSEFIYFIF